MYRLLIVLAVSVAICGATPVITFNSLGANVPFGHTGTITYDPRSNPAKTAIGQGIDIDSLFGTGTTYHSGVTAACFSCVLDFTTGTNLNDVSPNGTTWSFAGGGVFSIHGAFDLNGNGVLDANDIQPGTLLLQGMFNAPITVNLANNSVDFKFVSATLITTMDNQLDAFYGDPGNSTFNGQYSQRFASLVSKYGNLAQNHWRFSTYGPTSTQYTGMKDGSLVNTMVVPEPISFLLFATTGGILTFCMARCRRRTR